MDCQPEVAGLAEGGPTSVDRDGVPPQDNPSPPPPAHSYGSRDVQPGYESQGYTKPEPWGKDPWTDED